MHFSPRGATAVLAGDIGGTKILLELSRADTLQVLHAGLYSAAEHTGFGAVLGAFLHGVSSAGVGPLHIDSACFGIAGPVTGKRVRLTNLPWLIDAEALMREFPIDSIALVNDFVAAAHGVDDLGPGSIIRLQAGESAEQGTRVVLGAGTGFGTAYSVWADGGYQAAAGEGGHAGFAPADEVQAALWRDIFLREGRVSIEHVVSGPGLSRIYDYLMRTSKLSESAALRTQLDAGRGPAAISAHALEGGDALALAALDLFIACYGAAAGDQALALMARGGVYVAGGIAAKILSRLAAGGFAAAFGAKGVHSALLARIPLHVVTEPRLGLLGARRLALRNPTARSA